MSLIFRPKFISNSNPDRFISAAWDGSYFPLGRFLCRRHEPTVPVSVPVNVPVNERQQWFLNRLGADNKVKAADVAARWNVTEKTAKRDISALKKHGIIEFVGPPKTGSYRIRET